MSGPPRQPAHLRLLRGNPGKRPVPREVEPQSPEPLPEPPNFLSEDGKGEWRRLIAEMVRLKLVTSLDTMLFACYCESFAHWKAAVEALGRMAEKDALMHLCDVFSISLLEATCHQFVPDCLILDVRNHWGANNPPYWSVIV
jgi:phage terminase small subunit